MGVMRAAEALLDITSVSREVTKYNPEITAIIPIGAS